MDAPSFYLLIFTKKYSKKKTKRKIASPMPFIRVVMGRHALCIGGNSCLKVDIFYRKAVSRILTWLRTKGIHFSSSNGPHNRKLFLTRYILFETNHVNENAHSLKIASSLYMKKKQLYIAWMSLKVPSCDMKIS